MFNKEIALTVWSDITSFFRRKSNVYERNISEPDPVPKQSMSERLRRAVEAFRGQTRNVILERTTYKGTDVPSPAADYLEREWQSFENRKQLIAQIDQILIDDPFLLSGVQLLTHGSVSEGVVYNWKFDPAKANERQRVGMRELERVKEMLLPSFPTICEEWYIYGDHFNQIVTDRDTGKLISIDAMPVESMIRCSDEQDKFPYPERAYEQKDILNNTHIAYFSDFEIVHARYNKRSKDRYGRSGILTARQSSLHALRGYAQLIERRERSHPKEVHTFAKPLSPHQLLQYVNGIPGHPETALPQMRAKWGDVSAVKNPDAFTIANGGDVKIIQGDPRFNEIDDLLALVDRTLASVRVARGLISGDVINYATLNALWKQLFKVQQQIARMFEYHILRPINHRALLLVGVLPEEVQYECDWGSWQTPEDLQQNARISLAGTRAGIWPVRETVLAICRAVNRTDVDAVMAELQKEWNTGILLSPAQLQSSGAATSEMFIPQNPTNDAVEPSNITSNNVASKTDDENELDRELELAAMVQQSDIDYARSLYQSFETIGMLEDDVDDASDVSVMEY